MITFRLAGGRFPLNPEPPQRKQKTFTWEKSSTRIKPLTSKLPWALLYHGLSLSWPTRPKNLPYGAAHIHIAYIRENPLPGAGGGGSLLFLLYVFWCRRSILLIRYAVIFAWFCLCFWGWFWPIIYNFVCETSTWHLDSWPPGYTWYGVILWVLGVLG